MGKLDWTDARRAALFASFWPLVQRSNGDTCWLFIGPKSGHARRFVWRATRDRLPAGQTPYAVCGSQTCVHPRHLRLRRVS